MSISEPVIEAPAQPISPEELASQFAKMSNEQKMLMHFEHYNAEFIQKLTSFKGSKRSLQQAWSFTSIAFMKKEELKFSYPEAKELYNLFLEVFTAKMFLMLYGMEKDGKITIIQDPLNNILKQDKKEEENGKIENS